MNIIINTHSVLQKSFDGDQVEVPSCRPSVCECGHPTIKGCSGKNLMAVQYTSDLVNVAPECWSSGVHGTACCWPGPLPRITIYSWCSLLSVCHCQSATPLFSLFSCLPTAWLSVKKRLCSFGTRKSQYSLLFWYVELCIIGLRRILDNIFTPLVRNLIYLMANGACYSW